MGRELGAAGPGPARRGQAWPGAAWQGKERQGMGDYEAYLRSERWYRKRRAILKRDKHECRTCCSTHALEVHHRHYDTLYHEEPDDLITLCAECHQAITDRLKKRRRL